MKLREIWNKYNVSALLVLPIYSSICKDTRLKKDRKVSVPFLQLCFEMGLKQTYLHEDEFIVEFDKRVIEKNDLTEAVGFSLTEAFLASDYFIKVHVNDNSIFFFLSLRNEFKEDLDLIRTSKYSSVSPEYKKELMVSQGNIAILSNELSNNIVAYNIPYSIAMKAKHLKRDLSKSLQVDEAHLSGELFSEFNKDRERWHM